MDRERTPRIMLRVIVAVAAGLAAASFALGFLPGFEVYRGDDLLETRPVIEQWNWFLGILVVLLAPGAVVWRSPRIAYALLWSLWTIAVTVLVFVATFEPATWGVRVVAVWPARMFGVATLSLLVVLIAGLPVACGAYAWLARERHPRPTFPIARVVDRPSRRGRYCRFL